MKKSDVLIIGAGLLGCFAAMNLRKYDLDVAALERDCDVSTGISKANTGIVYSGYDVEPGTKKSEFCLRANSQFELLCNNLGVRFKRCGSLLISFGERGDSVIRRKYENGLANNVPQMKILDHDEILELEPNLNKDVRKALYAGTTGCVNPWELCIAAYECASANGAKFFLNQEVNIITRRDNGFYVETPKETYYAKTLINCAGLHSDRIRELTEKPLIRLYPSAGDYFVMDTSTEGFVRHVIFHEPEIKGKGLTLVPTIDGNLLVGPTRRDYNGSYYTNAGTPTNELGFQELFDLCSDVIPGLSMDRIIRTFASVRPDPFYMSEQNGEWIRGKKDISGFTILEENGMISMMGIKTPGMTCANELGKYAAEQIVKYLGGAPKNTTFDPVRKPIISPADMPFEEREAFIQNNPSYGKILCRCRQISEGEIKEAIRRGAVTADGVKRRVKAGSGRCQGAYCSTRIEQLLRDKM